MRISYDNEISPLARRTADAFLPSFLMDEQYSLIIQRLSVNRTADHTGLHLNAEANVNNVERRYSLDDLEILDPRYTDEDWERRSRELLRRGLLELIGIHPAWGILTGVRPGKLYQKLRKKGFEPSEIAERLQTIYRLEPQKSQLLLEVGKNQEPFLNSHARKIAIYVGIPFCPSRCGYCSFPSHPVRTHGHLIPQFVNSLVQEIRFFATLCYELEWTVEAVYIGGGTPTALKHEDLGHILQELHQFPLEQTVEITVEAGRPETLSDDHLLTCNKWGVNRISVNPQTLHDNTLNRIGREHTVQDFYNAVEKVRRINIPILNMDLIAGLPGEDISNLDQSLSRVMELKPENLTIHTLAPKRAAKWSQDQLKGGLSEIDLADWLGRAGQAIRRQGWKPYYLYRQRRIKAEQENIGYALPGKESLYNIWMMEETRTILGLGGGAITKWVHPKNGSVARLANPKCPATYSQRITENVKEKSIWLRNAIATTDK